MHRLTAATVVVVVSVVVASLTAHLGSASVGLGAHGASTTAPQDSCISTASARRAAALIRSAGGATTAAGEALLHMADTGVATGVDAALGITGTTPELSAVVVANNVKHIAVNPNMASDRSTRSLARTMAGGRTWYPTCGYGVRANAIWYCAQGSAVCQSSAQFSTGQVVSQSSPCPIVNRYPCQIYAYANPGPFAYVVWLRIFADRARLAGLGG
jgi:hypothetical protein